jgi:hypothetical protein
VKASVPQELLGRLAGDQVKASNIGATTRVTTSDDHL